MPQTPDTGGLAARPVPAPQPGVIDRLMALFGQNTAPSVDPSLPDSVKKGKALLQNEAPDINNVNIKSYGPISRALLGQAEGFVSPFGSIYINPELMKDQPPQQVADTLLHELTHVRQASERSPIQKIMEYMRQAGPYGQRPDEMDAFQAEADRRTKMGRAPLYGTPHFLDNSAETRGDITLPVNYNKK